MTAAVQVIEPGVYQLPPAVYHADPVPDGSLSHSGARLLLPPSCPALYSYRREHPPEPTREFDLGHAAHRVLLGAGNELQVIDAPNYLTKAAKEAKQAAYAADRIPVLQHQYEQVLEMAAAVHAHPHAGLLFRGGQPEQALFWRDRTYPDVWRRALLDYLPEPPPAGRRMLIPEYKTAKSAEQSAIERAMWDYGYHIQAGWYPDAVTTLGLAERAVLVLVVQEKTPPYLVTVAEPDAPSVRVGRLQAREAIEVYRQCRASGRWPGYADDVTLVSLPPWAQRQFTEETW